MNFCRRCGTRIVGAFCTLCGANVSQDAATSAGSNIEPVTGDQTKEIAEPKATLAGWMSDADASALPPPPPPASTLVATSEVSGGAAVVLPQGAARRQLVWETRFVMWAFLLPSVSSAVIVFVQHLDKVGDLTRFATIIKGHPVTNLALVIFAYLSVAAVVPIALFLLNRTGQTPKVLGLGVPRFKRDVLAGLGLGLAAFGVEVVMIIPFNAFLSQHKSLVNTVSMGHLPKYYLIAGIAMSAITAITEEVLVNGYLITRLGQLGWTPRKSLILSLILRTSYHVYYGLGFLLTVPFGFFVTRSFQKHHKLNRPIVAHFLFDAILFTIVILR